MLKNASEWSTPRTEGVIPDALLIHIASECGELSVAAIRLLERKDDAHQVSVIRELLSLAGFIEVLARDCSPEHVATLTASINEAFSDYMAKVAKIRGVSGADVAKQQPGVQATVALTLETLTA